MPRPALAFAAFMLFVAFYPLYQVLLVFLVVFTAGFPVAEKYYDYLVGIGMLLGVLTAWMIIKPVWSAARERGKRPEPPRAESSTSLDAATD